MKEPNTIWKCAECGIVFEALQPGEKGDDRIQACCGHALTRMMENRSDGAGEKHVPVAAPNGDLLKVSVGAAAHPMLEAHFIQWIEVVDGDMVYRKYLKPGDAPEAVFPVKCRSGIILREYCNLHGLWAFAVP
jgi:superoxide reductase